MGVWRQPAEQEKSKTKRREKDISAEVLRGYEVARAVIDRGLAKHPDDWALVLARATLMHDENNYRQEIETHARVRTAAAAGVRRVSPRGPALRRGGAGPSRRTTRQPRSSTTGTRAGLGACDPQHITEETLPDQHQPKLIREALAKIPGESGERHMSKFANGIFTRLSQVKPSIKFRYLKAGFEIVGDHPQAYDARKVFDYYKDLVTEIQLEAKVDGSDVVGHDQPFGLFVSLRHTREIERESGGFGRYLQNQNNSGYSYYNFGRPLENYRDKFQDAAKKALEEHFEVMSVTFQDEKVNSKATNEYGWRVTPYAYLLLKARSPKVDKVPPLRLDLDFMDTSGYVVLPVESPAIPVDATPAKGAVRPFEKLQITQTLDERQAKDGKLILEVKATARGLVPDLDQILDVRAAGFEIDKTDDQGVSVSKFDPDSEANVIDSERTWLVTYSAAAGQPKPPSTFDLRVPRSTARRWSTSATSTPTWPRSEPRSPWRSGTRRSNRALTGWDKFLRRLHNTRPGAKPREDPQRRLHPRSDQRGIHGNGIESIRGGCYQWHGESDRDSAFRLGPGVDVGDRMELRRDCLQPQWLSGGGDELSRDHRVGERGCQCQFAAGEPSECLGWRVGNREHVRFDDRYPLYIPSHDPN